MISPEEAEDVKRCIIILAKKKNRNKPDAWLIQLEIVGLQTSPESLLKVM